MEFVVHNGRNMTIKAAFIAAFFASFFSVSQEVDDNPFTNGVITLEGSKSTQGWSVDCSTEGGITATASGGGEYDEDTGRDLCMQQLKGPYEVFAKDKNDRYPCSASGVSVSIDGREFRVQVCSTYYNSQVYMGGMKEHLDYTCPPDGKPEYTGVYGKGPATQCYNPADLVDYYEEQNALDDNDSYCDSLVLDAGNNTSQSMCYQSNSGVSCDVEKVTTNYGGSAFSYYKGTMSNPLGCSSDKEQFDRDGIGNSDDDCFTNSGVNYCAANKAKHCTSVQGSEICDDGCLETPDGFFCDAARHPDVGEGNSDYFDDNGTCSIVAGSAYRGACEELGGTWEKEGDYTEASCPAASIAGSCSVVTVGGCMACLDKGGTWTPDENANLSTTEKGLDNIAALSQKTNDALKTLELTGRKGNEALISTIKSTNGKIAAKLGELSGNGAGGVGGLGTKLDEIKEELEEESYTTTTNPANKSLINGLFSQSKINEVKTNSENLKTEIQTYINTGKAELASSLTISAPSSSGYQARSLGMYGNSFDLSLNRFSEYFSLLAGPVMLICSILAMFIILGRN